MAEEQEFTQCPRCGRKLMDLNVINSRVTSSRRQRVQLRQCPEHPEVRTGALVTWMPLAKALRFMTRVRNRDRRAKKVPQEVVSP